MRKLWFLCLALVLAMGSLGVGYAMWSDTLTITGNVNTGELVVEFSSQYDNDDGQQNDPMEAGSWSGFDTREPEWVGNRYEKNVASTTSTFVDGGTTAQILITGGYPCYWGSVAWDITNTGTIPVKLFSVKLIELSKNTPVWTGSIDLVIGTRYYVDVDRPNIDTTLDAGDDFSFILSAHGTDQIDPDTWANSDGIAYLDVTVHVEQDAEEKTLYDFKIEYVFAQWNE